MKIKQDVLVWLRGQAREAVPRECCGILWSRGDSPVEEFSPYPGPLFADRFRLDEDWLLQEFYRGRRDGLRAAGFYHSHPTTTAEPSSRDFWGHPPGARFLILSPSGEVRAFVRGVAGVREVELRVT